MTQTTRQYRIEYWVHSNLRSHGGKPFPFSLDGAEVELRLPGGGEQRHGFIASAVIGRSALLDAERDAHDLLMHLLNLLSFEVKIPGLVEDRLRSQVEESGDIRHCAIYSTEKKEIPLFLMEKQAGELQQLLRMEVPDDIEQALFWLRRSYVAELVLLR